MPYLQVKKDEIDFVDSFPADTAIVTEVIDKLIRDLKTMAYSPEEREEIILSMDEAITNAVQETLCQNYTGSEKTCVREITIRYRIAPDEFDATVIDHGKGLDIEKMINKTPDSSSTGYQEQIYNYIDTHTSKKLQVRLNGHEILLNGIGAGLKIILSFMDSVKIDLIDRQHVVSNAITDHTDGTILNMKRHRRYP
jgi:anti-sigma regulatory factor (Ser/Thr protein kinase)